MLSGMSVSHLAGKFTNQQLSNCVTANWLTLAKMLTVNLLTSYMIFCLLVRDNNNTLTSHFNNLLIQISQSVGCN